MRARQSNPPRKAVPCMTRRRITSSVSDERDRLLVELRKIARSLTLLRLRSLLSLARVLANLIQILGLWLYAQ